MKTQPNEPLWVRRPFKQKISQYSSALKKQFPELLDRAIAKKAVKLLARTLLPPAKRGRPLSPEVTRAVELVKQREPWRKIPWLVIPGYGELLPGERSYERDRLYRAVYMRLKRERNRQKRELFVE